MDLRQDRMTREERLDALLRYRRPDRVALSGMAQGFCTVSAGHTVADAYIDPAKMFHDKLWTQDMYGWDRITSDFAHSSYAAWDFGGEMQLPNPESRYEGAMKVSRVPVETEEDVWNLKLPDYRTAGKIPQAMQYSRMQNEHNMTLWILVRSPFTFAANICGVARFCRWMVKKPELCHRLIELGMDHVFNVLKYWCDTFGADRIFHCMSSPTESNQIVSARSFETFALPYHAEFHKKLRDLGIKSFYFHICGEQNMNLPIFAESCPWPHPSILCFGHEVDVDTAAKYFPHDIIAGNIEPALIQTGTPRQVYEACRVAIEKGKNIPAGFVLSPGCELPVWSPPINVFAMTKAVDDFGWYD